MLAPIFRCTGLQVPSYTALAFHCWCRLNHQTLHIVVPVCCQNHFCNTLIMLSEGGGGGGGIPL